MKTVDLGELRLYVDGAARGNPGPAGIGAVAFDDQDREMFSLAEYIGEATNNMAEYVALVVGLEEARDLDPKNLKIFSDSRLLVEGVKGNFTIKKPHLKVLNSRIKVLLESFSSVDVTHVKREANAKADALANQAIDEFASGKRPKKEIQEILPESLF